MAQTKRCAYIVVHDGGDQMNKALLFSLNKNANIADQWDFGFLKTFLQDNDFEMELATKLSNTERAIVVIPARHHAGMESDVNKQLQKINHVVLFLMGDEEAEFDVEQINHPSIHIWVQNPHMGKHDAYNKIGTGYPEHFVLILNSMVMPDKTIDIFYSGQRTHDRRFELSDALVAMSHSKYKMKHLNTKGFTQGLDNAEYARYMADAKIAPAPSGAVIPDSFRLFEALEAMAIPIADQKTASGDVLEYWDWLFNDITPFPKTSNWFELPSVVDEALNDYPKQMHKIVAWYIRYKRDFKIKVLEQYHA